MVGEGAGQTLPLVRCVQEADCVHGSLLHFAPPGVQRRGAGQPVSLQPTTRGPPVNFQIHSCCKVLRTQLFESVLLN